jgi:signal transduction histidine kinase
MRRPAPSLEAVIKVVVSVLALAVVVLVTGTVLHEEYIEQARIEREQVERLLPTLERLSPGELRLFSELSGKYWSIERYIPGEPAEVSFTSADGGRWKVVFDGRGIFSDLVIKRRRVLLVGMVALLFAVEAAVFLAYSITRPVKAMVWACREVASGRWVHVPGRARRFLEFETLRATFDEMVDELIRMKNMERQIDRVKRLAAVGQVVAGVSHEIRNPLASMRVHLDLVSEMVPEEGKTSVAVIDQELDRLNRTVTELLRFARPMEPVKGPVGVRELFDWCYRMVKNQLLSRGIEWKEKISGDGLCIWGDTSQLQQVLLNLVLNSVRAMSKEGGTLEVAARKEGDQVILEVSDTGPGIPPDLVERVFDPFFTTYADGTGLGLSIVQQIVEKHGGVIDFETSESGTTFVVALRSQSEREE